MYIYVIRAVASHKKMVRPVQQTWTLHHQCAKHTQHAMHANAGGLGGYMLPRKNLKNTCCDIESGRNVIHNCLLQIHYSYIPLGVGYH